MVYSDAMMTPNRTLILLGGGYADVPLILSAKTLGYRVVTTGNRPQDIGHAWGDAYHPADFSDCDAMLALARTVGATAVCACCNDFAALSAAYVAERLGLPGHDPYDTAVILHHKDRFRAFARRHGLASPLAAGFDDIDTAWHALDRFRLPVIVKPVDLTGGKGISTVHTPAEARAALEKAFHISRAGRIVVEEFITGTRHGYSAFLRDGRVVFGFCDNEHYFINPYMVAATSAPGSVTDSAIKNLIESSEHIAQILKLKTGIFHIQFCLQGDSPVIIEICRRAPGDLYIKFVEHATGVDYASWIVRASAGLECGGLGPAAPRGFVTRHCVMSAQPGRVTAVEFDKDIADNVIDKVMWWKPGDRIDDVMIAKMGIVFLKFESRDEMLDKTERMQSLIRVRVG